MNDLLKPPAERDLPPGRATRMRAELLRATAAPRHRPARRRLLVAAAAALIAIAGTAATLLVRRNDGTQVLAMSAGEQDQELRAAVRQCLTWNNPPQVHPDSPAPSSIQVTAADVAVAARRGHQAAVLFLTDAGYYGCEVTAEPGSETSGGSSTGKWAPRGWLPGPVQPLSMSTSEVDGGEVAVLGRVSARVDRLILEHGDGRTTTARLRGGTFGLVSRTDDVRKNAELVSYDAAGREIGRRLLFQQSEEEVQPCYTDPAGAVVYGKPGPDCRPADPWTR